MWRTFVFSPAGTTPMHAFTVTCEAVMFDLDGVLIDSNDLYEAQWRDWADERGVSFQHIQRVHHGRPITDTIHTVAPHLDAVREAQMYKRELMHGPHWHLARPYAGAAELLRNLPPRRWAIVTSAPRDVAQKHLRRMQMPAPEVLVTGDDVSNGKPAPDPWLKAARVLGTPIARCVVIEDAPAGIASAKQAGAHAIALTTTNPPERLRKADAIAPDLAALSVVRKAGRVRIVYAASACSTASSV